MATRRNAKFIVDVLASRASLLLLGAITIWLGGSVAKEAYQKRQVNKEIAQLRQEILELESNNSDLASLLGSFRNPGTVELEAKRRLNLKKPGEEVAVILRDKNDEPQNIVQTQDGKDRDAQNTDESSNSNRLANPFKWWQYITNSK